MDFQKTHSEFCACRSWWRNIESAVARVTAAMLAADQAADGAQRSQAPFCPRQIEGDILSLTRDQTDTPAVTLSGIESEWSLQPRAVAKTW
jgi:hypothetical protein